jgi:parallel beta-helix repeat protein
MRKALLLLLAVSFSRAAEIRYYVSDGGNDAGNGRSARAAFKTISHALEIARGERKDGEAATVYISGTHRLDKPLELSESDSNLTLAATKGGHPVISGGRELKGFKAVSGTNGLYELEIPEAREGKWIFRQLFVNGERRQRARTPNEGFFRIEGKSPQDKPVKLKFKEGDIKKEWADDGDVEVVAFLAWADLRMQIRAVDETNRVATLSGDPRQSNQEADARYYIENAADALDQPGEWYLDRKRGVLRYWAMTGEDMNKVEVVAPMLPKLVTVRGNLETKKAAENITFRGLTFSHTDYALPTNGLADTQAAIAVRGDLLLEFAKNCVIENCTFSHLANYAIEAGRGAQGTKIRYCEMTDLGAGGIRIGETAKRTDEFEASHSNEVTDCHLHKLGRVFAPAVGVFILQSGTNLVAHNEINDLYYTAISVGWNWGYQETPCRANVIEFNHLHDVGQAMLSDMGGIYTLGIQRGTVLRNNLIHDINAFTYGGWGLYTDEGSTDILLENNVVYRCKSAGFHQHYGRDNIVRNNIFAFNKEHQLMRTREEEHNSFTFERNIVYYNSGDLLGSNWSNNHYRMDNNIYFDARPRGGDDRIFQRLSLAEWQRRGHDAHSLLIDPRFVNAAKFDFRLKRNSPASMIGFKPIDVSTVGPRSRKK